MIMLYIFLHGILLANIITCMDSDRDLLQQIHNIEYNNIPQSMHYNYLRRCTGLWPNWTSYKIEYCTLNDHNRRLFDDLNHEMFHIERIFDHFLHDTTINPYNMMDLLRWHIAEIRNKINTYQNEMLSEENNHINSSNYIFNKCICSIKDINIDLSNIVDINHEIDHGLLHIHRMNFFQLLELQKQEEIEIEKIKDSIQTGIQEFHKSWPFFTELNEILGESDCFISQKYHNMNNNCFKNELENTNNFNSYIINLHDVITKLNYIKEKIANKYEIMQKQKLSIQKMELLIKDQNCKLVEKEAKIKSLITRFDSLRELYDSKNENYREKHRNMKENIENLRNNEHSSNYFHNNCLVQPMNDLIFQNQKNDQIIKLIAIQEENIKNLKIQLENQKLLLAKQNRILKKNDNMIAEKANAIQNMNEKCIEKHENLVQLESKIKIVTNNVQFLQKKQIEIQTQIDEHENELLKFEDRKEKIDLRENLLNKKAQEITERELEQKNEILEIMDKIFLFYQKIKGSGQKETLFSEKPSEKSNSSDLTNEKIKFDLNKYDFNIKQDRQAMLDHCFTKILARLDIKKLAFKLYKSILKRKEIEQRRKEIEHWEDKIEKLHQKIEQNEDLHQNEIMKKIHEIKILKMDNNDRITKMNDRKVELAQLSEDLKQQTSVLNRQIRSFEMRKENFENEVIQMEERLKLLSQKELHYREMRKRMENHQSILKDKEQEIVQRERELNDKELELENIKKILNEKQEEQLISKDILRQKAILNEKEENLITRENEVNELEETLKKEQKKMNIRINILDIREERLQQKEKEMIDREKSVHA